MSDNWYYVLNGERKGPTDEADVKELISTGVIGNTDYVWRKGFENWLKLEDVEELQPKTVEPINSLPPKFDETPKVPELRIKDFAGESNSIYIKIGSDRGSDEVEYGPFSITLLKRLYDEKRINGKTFTFIKGMTNWSVLADFLDYAEIFEEMPPMINDSDRRVFGRKPFIARMFIQNHDQVFEGICRDISVGGMQVLVDNFPGASGEHISINVHPENTEHHFVANGEIVRVLDNTHGFSFRFTKLKSEAIEAINNYLNNE